MRRAHRSFVIVVAATCLAASGADAQRLAPITEDQQCRGEEVVAMQFRGIRRELLPRHLDPLANIANRTVLVLQPPTRTRLLRRFLVVHEGMHCSELARAESERVLRAQPFISDAAIRAVVVGPGQVRLDVETIDEYVLFFQSWGWSGLPAGFEAGTGNFAGTGRSVRALLELGRGRELGWGLQYVDRLFLGRPLTLETAVKSRPFEDYAMVSLSHPWYTNFQRDTWSLWLSDGKAIYTFRDPTIRDISLDYRRTQLSATWARRLGGVDAPWQVGAELQHESADLTRVVQIRENGPIPVAPPPELARYGPYDATRVGIRATFRDQRYVPIRGLGALSAPEDLALGFFGTAGLRIGVPALQRDPADRVLAVAGGGGLGNTHLVFRWWGDGQWTTARPGTAPAESNVAGRAGLNAKITEADVTTLRVAVGLARNARIPTQRTLRDDYDGVLGYRTLNAGGGQSVVYTLEERLRIPSPISTTELGIAGMVQRGRLWAGDAPYGVDTPWRTGVGAALLVGYPAGSKQMLRIEIGLPLHPPPGLGGRELRLVYSDFTGRF